MRTPLKESQPIPITPVTFTLTEKDIQRYRDVIDRFPLENEDTILKQLPSKLRGMLAGRTFSTFIVDLVNDIEILYDTLDSNKELPMSTRKMILFALSYFIEELDEIPDSIDVLGFVDDAVVIRWVVNEIIRESPEILKIRK